MDEVSKSDLIRERLECLVQEAPHDIPWIAMTANLLRYADRIESQSAHGGVVYAKKIVDIIAHAVLVNGELDE